MITSFFKFYLMNNIALIVAYGVTRLLVELPFFGFTSATQKLQLARFSFLLTLGLCILLPFYQPLTTNVTTPISFVSFNAPSDFILTIPHQKPMISLMAFLCYFCLFGMLMQTIAYGLALVQLWRLKQDAYVVRVIKTINVLCSEKITTPFCWSFFNKHFIMVPMRCFERDKELRLILLHELQHLRRRDTYWLQLVATVHAINVCNPFAKAWLTLIAEWQEYACDEALIIHRKVSPYTYASCLLANLQPNQDPFFKKAVPNLKTSSNFLVYRRIAMLFNNQLNVRRRWLCLSYLISSVFISSAAFALNDVIPLKPMSTQEVATLIRKDQLESLHITATPEVVAEINQIRQDLHKKIAMRQALQRLNVYKPVILSQLEQHKMPADLLALPLLQSGYRALPASANRVSAAGIWQIIPDTAIKLGLTVNKKEDERLSLEPSTTAALSYLNALHHEFGDWKLAVIAYEYGEILTAKLVKESKSKEAWQLAKAKSAPVDMQKYLRMFDANVIIMHNPQLVA